MTKCACGSGAAFSSCCEPYLKGQAKPATAELLMRSRYTAFATANVDYIEKTTDPSQRQGFDHDGTNHWAKSSEWKGLEIVSTDKGGPKDTMGTVEFIANYQLDGVLHAHHERSEFKRRDGEWFFLDGKLVQKPFRAEERVGRNDPCTCGSGKKFKKCCGVDA